MPKTPVSISMIQPPISTVWQDVNFICFKDADGRMWAPDEVAQAYNMHILYIEGLIMHNMELEEGVDNLQMALEGAEEDVRGYVNEQN